MEAPQDNLQRLVREMALLLGLGKIEGESYPEHPAFDTARNALSCIRSQNEFNTNFHLSRIAILLKNIRELESLRPDLLKDFRKKIRACASSDNFNGLRFELNVAASFARLGIAYNRSERPDYFVQHARRILPVECTSVRLPDFSQPKNYLHKVVSSVRKKSKKGHYGADSALFIDITNVAAMALFKDELFDHNMLKTEISKEVIENPSFGNVTMFIYMTDHTRGYYEMQYSRFDASYITAELLDFMDRYYPYSKAEQHEGVCTIAREA